MTFDDVKDRIRSGGYVVSQHALVESARDEIDDEDIRHAVMDGEVIESYPDDRRGESMLVSGRMRDGRHLHAVLGTAHDELVIITVYLPEPPKWVSPSRRGGRKQ